MLRVFVPSTEVTDGRVRITGAELKHLRTLRLGRGARLVVFDEAGLEHDVRIDKVWAQAAEATIAATRRPERESRLALRLAPALLKGDKMDLVIEKATELGVVAVSPVVARHSIARRAPTERWRRIALAAAKQSGRTRVPTVDEPVALAALLAAPRPGLGVVAWEGETTQGLADLPADAGAATLVVGPEGGFAGDEVELARRHGFVTMRLAPRILRAETAAIAAVVLCQQRWGDVG
ncbi:MAG TPA: RsmE family RNA methyltransferase [Candidatus Binatia bacterium]|nr:RsmE family RNA methyltransferase [Candidatus Binatia bacterium]